jgi:hypothetical protein
MRTEGIDFEQCANAFLKCSHPQKLQQLADSLSAHDLLSCGQRWLACLTAFFKETCGCQHRLFFSQAEYCDNLIFKRRAALDHLDQRLLDANRTTGQPKKSPIFGRKVTKFYKGKKEVQNRLPLLFGRSWLAWRSEPGEGFTAAEWMLPLISKRATRSTR